MFRHLASPVSRWKSCSVITRVACTPSLPPACLGGRAALDRCSRAVNAEGATVPRFLVFDTPSAGSPCMSADAVTLASVLAAVQADLRLPTQRDKCMTFPELPAFSKLSLRLVCVTDLPLGSG